MNKERISAWSAVAENAVKTEKKVPKGIDENGEALAPNREPSAQEKVKHESLMASLEELVPENLQPTPSATQPETTQKQTTAAEAAEAVSEDIAADALKAVEEQLSEKAPAAISTEETGATTSATDTPEGKVSLKKVAHHAESPATYEDVAAFSVEAAQARMELTEIIRTAPEGFVEAQPEYTALQRLLRKIDPLISGDWKEDPSIALLQVQNGLQRITENLNTLHTKVVHQKEKLANSFGNADTQEALAATLGDLRKKTFATEAQPKKKGWWNANQLFAEDFEDEGLNTVPGPREKKAEVIEPLPELSQKTKDEIAHMRAQIARVTTTTNERRKKVELSHADAKSVSEGYAHARSTLLRLQNELRNIESTGVEVRSERMGELRTQLAEALREMKQDFSEEKKGTENMEAADVYKKIRTELETLTTNTTKLVTAYPELQEDPHYLVLQGQLQKLGGYVQEDASMQGQYETIRAVLANAEQGFVDLSEKVEVKGIAKDFVQTESEEQATMEAKEDSEGLFAWGEKENMLGMSGEHLEALASEHKDLQETAEYREAKMLFDELTTAGAETDPKKLDIFTQAVRKLHALGIQKKIEAKHVETESSEPVVLTEAMRVDSSDSIGEHEESAEAEVAEQLFGMRIPQEGADGWYGARAFHEALKTITARKPELFEDAAVRKAINEIKFILQDLPKNGLTPEEVVRIAQLSSVIAMPESLLQKKPRSVEAMRAETERKLQERLPALEGKKGGVKRKVALGVSAVSGLLARKILRKQSS